MIPRRAEHVAADFRRYARQKHNFRQPVASRPGISKRLIADGSDSLADNHFHNGITTNKRFICNRHIQDQYGIRASADADDHAVLDLQPCALFQIIHIQPFCIQRDVAFRHIRSGYPVARKLRIVVPTEETVPLPHGYGQLGQHRESDVVDRLASVRFKAEHLALAPAPQRRSAVHIVPEIARFCRLRFAVITDRRSRRQRKVKFYFAPLLLRSAIIDACQAVATSK